MPNLISLLAYANNPELYELRTYEETMKDAMFKMNWQLSMGDEIESHIKN